jgi:hypothetical protein
MKLAITCNLEGVEANGTHNVSGKSSALQLL